MVCIVCVERVTVATVAGITVGTTGSGIADFRVARVNRSKMCDVMEAAAFCGPTRSDFSREASHFSGPMWMTQESEIIVAITAQRGRTRFNAVGAERSKMKPRS